MQHTPRVLAADLWLTRNMVHLGGRLELKERELDGREKNGAKSRFLIKAQMFNGKCAYKGGGGGGGPFPPIHSWSPAAGDDVQNKVQSPE